MNFFKLSDSTSRSSCSIPKMSILDFDNISMTHFRKLLGRGCSSIALLQLANEEAAKFRAPAMSGGLKLVEIVAQIGP
jgi:hypothetical protein